MTAASPIVFLTEQADAGLRLDKLLATRLSEISRSRLKVLIEQGAVQVAGAACDDPSRKLHAGEEIALLLPAAVEALPQAEHIPLVIVHEDDGVIVIDKPAGLVVHPSAGHEKGTLVNALLYHCRESLSGINGVMRPGIVHRLDKDTSGLIVVAKNDASHRALAAQFADHGREGVLARRYLALCWGVPHRPHGSIDAALARSTVNREKIAVVGADKGRFAVTHYRVLETFNGIDGKPAASLVQCELETGRTHQIRVHMAHIDHPLLGDATYGAGFKTKASRIGPIAQKCLLDLGRQALHAAVLGFETADGKYLEFESPLPADLTALVAALRTAT